MSLYKKGFVRSEEEADVDVDCSEGVSDIDEFDGLGDSCGKNRFNLRWTGCETLDFSSFSFGALELVLDETGLRVVRVDGKEVGQL